MTPERLEKIRRLANDHRGNPHMRQVAQEMLRKYGGAEEEWKPPPHKPAPGIDPSADYDRFIFMDLTTWNESANGNFSTFIKYRNTVYRFVLFRHKKTPTWGWLREDKKAQTESWGRNKYNTLREAHESAWLHLTLV